MTDLLYQTDSYRREFEATVVETTENGVVLDQTAFYPQGGGQPNDEGWLHAEDGRSWRVVGVKKAGLDLLSTFALSVLAGAFIAVGAVFATAAGAGSVTLTDATTGAQLTGTIPYGITRDAFDQDA